MLKSKFNYMTICNPNYINNLFDILYDIRPYIPFYVFINNKNIPLEEVKINQINQIPYRIVFIPPTHSSVWLDFYADSFNEEYIYNIFENITNLNFNLEYNFNMNDNNNFLIVNKCEMVLYNFINSILRKQDVFGLFLLYNRPIPTVLYDKYLRTLQDTSICNIYSNSNYDKKSWHNFTEHYFIKKYLDYCVLNMINNRISLKKILEDKKILKQKALRNINQKYHFLKWNEIFNLLKKTPLPNEIIEHIYKFILK